MRLLLAVMLTGLMLMEGASAPAAITPNLAPTISDIPSPVVANDIPVSGGGVFGNFLYPDALDLNSFATDDLTPPSNLIWTYVGSQANGGSSYRINGVSPINPAVIDPTSPPAALIINRNDDPMPGKDSLKNTITIRNNRLSPLSGSGSLPSTTGIVAQYTEPITFFCSDGNSFSSQTIFFYTHNGGNDRLSGGEPPIPPNPPRPDKITKFWRKNEWNLLKVPKSNFQLTTSTVPGLTTGVCLVAGLHGQNWGALVSPYPYFNLASNQVYRIRMKMLGSQTTPGKTPYWDLTLENYDELHPATLNMYVFTTKIYDVEGGANALTTTPRTVTLYWAPPAVATPQWNDAMTGAFTSRRDAYNDPRLRFRVIDFDNYAGGEIRGGSVCIQEIEVASAAYSRVTPVGSPLVNITKFVQSKRGGTVGNVAYMPIVNSWSAALFNSDGSVTLTPIGEGQRANLAILGPSTDDRYDSDPEKVYNYDEYPIPWKSDQILRLSAGMSAPTATDAAHPWDAFCFTLLSLSNEVNAESYITSSAGCGAPRTGTPQTYTSFFYTHNETKSTVEGYHRLRWEIRFLNSPMVNFPTGNEYFNTGRVKVNNLRVEAVEFK